MPETTPVNSTLSPCGRARIRSCWGPMAFFRPPRISTRNSSRLLPSNTVRATPSIPAWMPSSGSICITVDADSGVAAGFASGIAAGAAGAGVKASRQSAGRTAASLPVAARPGPRRGPRRPPWHGSFLFLVVPALEGRLDRLDDVVLHRGFLVLDRFVHQAGELELDLDSVFVQRFEPAAELVP